MQSAVPSKYPLRHWNWHSTGASIPGRPSVCMNNPRLTGASTGPFTAVHGSLTLPFTAAWPSIGTLIFEDCDLTLTGSTFCKPTETVHIVCHKL